jgi:hypothetical protein
MEDRFAVPVEEILRFGAASVGEAEDLALAFSPHRSDTYSFCGRS